MAFRRWAYAIMAVIAVNALWDDCAPTAAHAESHLETLSSIRQEIGGLYSLVRGLQKQLTPPPDTKGTGKAPGANTVQVTGTVQERLDAIESRLAQLTNQTEELQHRIELAINDGTKRIGDLNYRLCELEKGCDISKIGKTPPLGGTGAATGAVTGAAGSQGDSLLTEAPPATTKPDLAVGEQAAFDKAKAALDAKKYAEAAQEFATFTNTYTAGPLTGQAHFYRGEALTALGKTADAARAYLKSFSGSPDGPRAPDALVQLGVSLGALGQVQEACLTLEQVSVRYPASSAVTDAAAARQNLNCQ